MIRQGASPRASLALTAMAKASAWVNGRDYVVPSDVRLVFRDVIEHRLIWAPECTGRKALLRDLFQQVSQPKIK